MQFRRQIESESAVRHLPSVRRLLDVTRQSFFKPNPACSQECDQGRTCDCGKGKNEDNQAQDIINALREAA